MTLDNLLRIGKLRAHTPDKIEIGRLLAAAGRALADAGLEHLSSDGRLDIAYRAIMQAALAAMLANGYRPLTSEPGHHQLIIQALPKTAGIAADRIRVLDGYRAARNQADYRGVSVSDAVAQECLAEAKAIVAEIRAWLAGHPPPLME